MGSGEAVQSLAAILRWGESDLEGGEGEAENSKEELVAGAAEQVLLNRMRMMKMLRLCGAA